MQTSARLARLLKLHRIGLRHRGRLAPGGAGRLVSAPPASPRSRAHVPGMLPAGVEAHVQTGVTVPPRRPCGGLANAVRDSCVVEERHDGSWAKPCHRRQKLAATHRGRSLGLSAATRADNMHAAPAHRNPGSGRLRTFSIWLDIEAVRSVASDDQLAASITMNRHAKIGP